MFTPTFPTRIQNELRQELGRASFGKAPYTAVVQGGQIRSGEQALSPSAFANLRGGGNRNAWRAVWLRFPDSEQWVLADTCRALQKTAITRLF